MPQKAEKIVHEVPAQHLIAAVLQSDWLVGRLQGELSRVLPDLTMDQIRVILRNQVLKRDVIEGPEAHEASTLIRRVEQLRASGLTMTQTVKILTEEEEAYRIMIDDKRSATGGG